MGVTRWADVPVGERCGWTCCRDRMRCEAGGWASDEDQWIRCTKLARYGSDLCERHAAIERKESPASAPEGYQQTGGAGTGPWAGSGGDCGGIE